MPPWLLLTNLDRNGGEKETFILNGLKRDSGLIGDKRGTCILDWFKTCLCFLCIKN